MIERLSVEKVEGLKQPYAAHFVEICNCLEEGELLKTLCFPSICRLSRTYEVLQSWSDILLPNYSKASQSETWNSMGKYSSFASP